MSEDLIVRRSVRSEIVAFDPSRFKYDHATLEAALVRAQKLGNVAEIDAAVDAILDLQTDFVAWWDANVTPRSRMNRHTLGNADRSYLCLTDAEDLTQVKQQQVSRWRTRLKRRDEYRANLVGAMYRLWQAHDGVGVLETLNTGDMEGYTPAAYVEAARRAMGSIDLDPASCEQAQQIVRAKRYFSKIDDGLAQDWHGTVFLNPPYASGLIEKFIGKLLEELAVGKTTAAILLTNNNTDTRWFHDAARKARAICLTKGRINFYKPDSSIVAPTNGQAFFYFGLHCDCFIKSFDSIGLLLQTVNA